MSDFSNNRDEQKQKEWNAAQQAEQELLADPYGTAATGSTGTSASFRQRGSSTQKRVNTDTRVRDDANSGTAGAGGAAAGKTSMQMALSDVDTQQAPSQGQQSQIPQNASWTASRPAVDINSVRQRVLQSLTPKQGQ